jgi:hypothetical protein
MINPRAFDAAAPVWFETRSLPDQPVYETRQSRQQAKERRERRRIADAKPFCCWDGEGVTLPDGSHVYTLLQWALIHPETGEVQKKGHRAAPDTEHPLTSAACFDFILKSAAALPRAHHVWFSFSYDVNMMLGDLPTEELQTLYDRDGKWTYCPSLAVNIQFRAKKTFALRKKYRTKSGSARTLHIEMCDTFTFFGTSFVRAVDTYLPADWPDRDLVLQGKEERKTGFNTVDTLAYNLAELRALGMTMNELRRQLHYVGIYPRSWHGPGALASSILQMHNVNLHSAEMPAELMLQLRHAYAGGRFEMIRYGSVMGPSWRWDLHSAYPWAATQLTTAQGHWTHVDAVAIEATRIETTAIYQCEWRCDYAHEKYPQPFYVRDDVGHILYPPHLQQWVWGPEVIQAQRLPYGHLFIDQGWVFTPDNDSKPFAFLEDYYKQRQQLQAQKHPAQLALKLGINSVYGKLIQQLGWERDEAGEVVPPNFFNLFWASQITSLTRAKLLQLVIDNEGYEDVISFETDAVFASRRWTIGDFGVGLGQWEEEELTDLSYLQSGVYATREGVSHMRGMAKIMWPDDPIAMLRSMLVHRDQPYLYELTAFVGMGTGLSQDMSKWRTWQTVTRKLQVLEPYNGIVKRNHDLLTCECQDDEQEQLDRWHRTRVWPQAYRGKLQRAYDLQWEGATRTLFDSSEIPIE